MKTLNPYITFNGNCREAMEFYHRCLGGDLRLQTLSESPVAQKLPGNMKEAILHAELTCKHFVLMGSDMVQDEYLVKGNAMGIVLHCTSEKEVSACYNKLSQGGKQTHPLKTTFWGTLFGCLTDKYGNHWLLNYSKDE